MSDLAVHWVTGQSSSSSSLQVQTWNLAKMDRRLAASSFCPMDAHTSVYTTSAPFTACQQASSTPVPRTVAWNLCWQTAQADWPNRPSRNSTSESLLAQHRILLAA